VKLVAVTGTDGRYFTVEVNCVLTCAAKRAFRAGKAARMPQDVNKRHTSRKDQ
jgi:hypothetical protein